MTGNMNSDVRSSKKASMNQVHPVIETFFTSMPDDTWASLMVDWLDGSSRDDLKKLLQKVTMIISDSVIDSLTDQKQICEEDVLSSWGHVVPEAFALAVGASEDVSCESADEFDKLIIAEVVRSVNAAVYTDQKTVETLIFKNRLGGHRLNTLVHVADKMIKSYYKCSLKLQKKQRKLDRKTKNLQSSKHKRNTSLLQEDIISLTSEVEESLKNEVESSLEFSLGEVLESSSCTVCSPEQLTSEVKEVTDTGSSEDLKEKFQHALSMVNETIWKMEAVPITAAAPRKRIAWGVDSDDDDDDDNGLQKDIVELPATPVTSLTSEEESLITETESSTELSLEGLPELYLPEQLTSEVKEVTDTGSSEDLKEKFQHALSMVNETIWKMEAVPITAAAPRKRIAWGVDSDDDDNGLQKDIVELPATPVTSLTSEEESLITETESSTELSLEGLPELYLPEELTSEVKEVRDTADDPYTPAEVHLCEQPAPRASATEVSAKRSVTEVHRDSINEKMFKLSVDVCAESLVQRLVRKAPQLFDEDDVHALKTRLCDKFWLEIQNKYSNIPIKKFNKLDRLIYKSLRKDCKYTPHMLKQCMEQDDSPFEKTIIYYYSKHLAPPSKKRSPVPRISSAIGGAITKVFKVRVSST